MRNLSVISLFILALAVLAACSEEQPFIEQKTGKVYEYKLKNGLRLIVKEDHRSPVVVSQIWYKVGSSYEYNGITGVSHVLEHMMFKGTKQLGPNEFSKIISANGGSENAFTNRDYTGYYQSLEKSRLPVSFRLEADRMQNLVLAEKEFEKERQVVIEERRLRTEDKPMSLTYEKFAAVAFQNSPYRYPVIGWMNDLENMTVKDLQTWYSRWYAPNNAIVVVVGDVKPREVLQLAQKYFGNIKARTIQKPKPQIEVKQAGIKRLVVKAPANVSYLLMGYHVPSVKTAKTDWEPYALDVLAWLLDGGRSARLSTSLIRSQGLAANTNAWYDPFSRLSRLFVIDGVPAKDKSVAELEQGIRQEVEKLKQTLASKEELQRVKAQVVAETIYRQDSMFYQAMLIGQMEVRGYSWKRLDDYVNQINKVTPEQVRAVAQKYLIDDHLTIATLDPQPLDAKSKKRRSLPGVRHGH